MKILLYFLAFAISIISGRFIISKLRDMKIKQVILEIGPNWHMSKQGTPTMGGIIFLIAFLIPTIVLAFIDSEIWMLIFVTVGFGAIGFIDDYAKVRKRQNAGLSPMQKIILQLIVIIIFAIYLVYNNMAYEMYIPFVNKSIYIGYLFFPMVVVVMLGTVNGVNLTDGIDGLATSVTIVSSIGLSVMANMVGKGEIRDAIICMIAALLGFLYYNSNPAKVFMGDSGSLALGGFIAALAYLLKAPVFIILLGAIYLIESVSVILQVGYFKLTHGKRLFKMSPIHHHYEKSGWGEKKIVVVFSIIAAIFTVIGVVLYWGAIK